METVKNIVEEMRFVALRYLEDGNDSASVFEILSSYADRLDAAYKRDMQSMVETGERDMEKLKAMLEKEQEEKEDPRIADMFRPRFTHGEPKHWWNGGMLVGKELKRKSEKESVEWE